MKRPVLKLSAWPVLGLLTAFCWCGGIVAGAQGQGESASPAAEESPAPSNSPAKAPGAKGAKGGADKTKNKPASKEIPIILPVNEIAKNITIPQNGLAGQLLSKLAAVQMKRIDADHMEIEGMKMDLYQPDGKTDFFIEVPTSIFDLKTRMIHSDHPVTVRTKDFELTGEKMEFDTVERTGKLLGRVEMHIHNLKQVAGDNDDSNE